MPESRGTQCCQQPGCHRGHDEVSAEARALGAPPAAALDRWGSNDDSIIRTGAGWILGSALEYLQINKDKRGALSSSHSLRTGVLL